MDPEFCSAMQPLRMAAGDGGVGGARGQERVGDRILRRRKDWWWRRRRGVGSPSQAAEGAGRTGASAGRNSWLEITFIFAEDSSSGSAAEELVCFGDASPIPGKKGGLFFPNVPGVIALMVSSLACCFWKSAVPSPPTKGYLQADAGWSRVRRAWKPGRELLVC